MSEAPQRKEEQQWAIEKPNLDNERKLRGILFIDPDDKEFKETILKRRSSTGKPVTNPTKSENQKHACISKRKNCKRLKNCRKFAVEYCPEVPFFGRTW